jgi:hypothetical protein
VHRAAAGADQGQDEGGIAASRSGIDVKTGMPKLPMTSVARSDALMGRAGLIV